MGVRKKIMLAGGLALLILLTALIVIFTVTNKSYTITVREMPATLLDEESFIEYADINKIIFYNWFQYYDNAGDVQPNYGALDIVYYYSVDCDYTGIGTHVKCEVVESGKDDLILHYYGNAVTGQGETVNVDDRWKVDMNSLWNGNYAGAELI